MRETTHRRKKSNIKDIILNNIYDNLKSYIIVITIFIIGIILGVIFINNITESQTTEIGNYINNFINALKQDYRIDKGELLKSSLWDNLFLIVSMWFIGSTVIGIPIVFGIVLFRGFCIGYTISAIIGVLGVQKGIIFLLSTIFIQNLLFIPVIICMTVSCIKLYKSIMKDKRRENIKLEIIRHTLISIILLIILIISSLIEVYISTNLLMLCINFL